MVDVFVYFLHRHVNELIGFENFTDIIIKG